MDELYLVIQKLNGIIEVSMHIADQYGFPVDIRDVKLAIDAILDKFDELIEPTTDYSTIKNELSNFRELRRKFYALEPQVNEELKEAAGTEDIDSTSPSTISLWTKTKNTFKKNIRFSASTFVQELNEAVAYLALYVGIFSSSFSITYTTVVAQLLANGRTDELKTLQNKLFSDTKFYGMVEGAVVYPLLQSQKTYNTCMLKSGDSSCESTFVLAGESMRKNMTSLFDKKNAVSSDLYNAMTNLKEAITITTPITTATEANNFADAIDAAFKKDKASAQTASVAPVTPAPVAQTSTSVAQTSTSEAQTSVSEAQTSASEAQTSASEAQTSEAVAPEAVAPVSAPTTTPAVIEPSATSTAVVEPATRIVVPSNGPPRRSNYPAGEDGYAEFEKALNQFQIEKNNQRKAAAALYAQTTPKLFMNMQSGTGVIPSQKIQPERQAVEVSGGSRTMRRVQKNRHNTHSRKTKSKY
jgi:hypothetical protein